MAMLIINPRHETPLRQQGLHRAQDFLGLSGVIYCGHPDRHVARAVLGNLSVFVKKEHRVPWRDRLRNAWAGFGLVSKSLREMRLLREVRAAGFGCPEVLAAGEVGGRAFLLLEEQRASNLRELLEETIAPNRRRALARELGSSLARLHNAGFVHGDLYAKHVLVSEEPGEFRISLLDWQRGYRRRRVGYASRVRELAALDATLPTEIVAWRDRLRLVAAYLRAAQGLPSVGLEGFALAIATYSKRLQRRRHVREARQSNIRPGTQNLIWLDGEALCVTREFLEQTRGKLPECLRLAEPSDRLVADLDIAEIGRLHLVRRWASQPWRWLWAKLCRRRFATPELAQAAALFRLQRYGVATPRLWAMGQRLWRPWRSASFLLIEPIRGAAPLATWLPHASPAQREWSLREASAVLGRIHDAGYVLDGGAVEALAIRERGPDAFTVVLASLTGLRRCKTIGQRLARRDYAALARQTEAPP